jgi:hypothetical protein
MNRGFVLMTFGAKHGDGSQRQNIGQRPAGAEALRISSDVPEPGPQLGGVVTIQQDSKPQTPAIAKA